MQEYMTPHDDHSQSPFASKMNRRSLSVPRLSSPSTNRNSTSFHVSETPNHTAAKSNRWKNPNTPPRTSRKPHFHPVDIDSRDFPMEMSKSNAEWRELSENFENLSISSNDSTKFSNPDERTTVIVQVKAHRTPETTRKTSSKISSRCPRKFASNNDLKHITGGVKVLPTEPKTHLSTNFPNSLSKSVPDVSTIHHKSKSTLPHENFELNTLKVFRQPKYKHRRKTEQQIKQHDHLKNSIPCQKHLQFVNEQCKTGAYENQTNDATFRNMRINHKSSKENIYEEIDETHTTQFKKRQQILIKQQQQKKVSFQLPTEALHGSEEMKFKKKIIAARLCGMAEVIKPLRHCSDEQRRTISRMCYRAVRLKYTSYSLNFLGKIDLSRSGEEIFLVMEKDCFEICDSNGLVLTSHRKQDISVITAIPEESRVVSYIGKCKFSGRIAMVIKFNKSKHVSLLNTLFMNHSTNNTLLM